MNLQEIFNNKSFIEGVKSLFATLNIAYNTVEEKPFAPAALLGERYKVSSEAHQLMSEVYFLGIVNDAALNNEFPDASFNIESLKSNDKDYEGLAIIAVSLKAREGNRLPSRTQLSEIARAFNQAFPTLPAAVVFRYDDYIAIASVERLKYEQTWRDGEKIGKVSLLKDIRLSKTHEGHRRILERMAFEKGKKAITTFDAAYKHWQEVFNTNILNKKFYEDLSYWYFHALEHVRFPNDIGENDDELKAKNLIRLLTRLIFVWFLKEKEELVPDELFDKKTMDDILDYKDKTNSTYYKAVLQNLFFATLNTEMNRDKNNSRSMSKQPAHGSQYYYRYQRFIKKQDALMALFENIPFLNGGLFECLDKKDDKDKMLRIDCFSDNPKNEERLAVPDFLFFGEEKEVDLDKILGKTAKKAKFYPLFTLLNRYKFTIDENTPIEEEVALDPELLGKVFENLLASYNPETQTTARKQTGSFYTPREIVDYMVDESLKAYLSGNDGDGIPDRVANPVRDTAVTDTTDNLDLLFAYNAETLPEFSEAERQQMIAAIDRIKILDPAVGSGAFPMGILQKLVFVLKRLDPDNTLWKEQQRQKASNAAAEAYFIKDDAERKKRLDEIEEIFTANADDYGRKLFLIENSIYGVDIQPIAVQICKLRFFISLIIEQRIDKTKPNLGIRPLPNLETKFVAANTLIGVEQPKFVQGDIFDTTYDEVKAAKESLRKIRERHFRVRTPEAKKKCRAEDSEIRAKLTTLLEKSYTNADTAKQLAAWNPYDQNASAPFFDTEWMFSFNEGFDVVIGNPPYVQLQKMKGSEIFAKQNYVTYSKSSDLYCIFYEKGVQLLRNKGILTYITSNSWMRTKYGELLRKYFAQKTNPLQLINFEDVQIFESAVVESNILITEKNSFQKELCAVNIGIDFDMATSIQQYVNSKSVVLSELDDNGWIVGDAKLLNLKAKIEEKASLIKDLELRINIGINTGLNEVFVINEEQKNIFLGKDKNNSNILKPILRGRDLKKYIYNYSSLWLICSHNGQKSKGIKPINVVNDYPIIFEYFSEYEDKLRKRYDQGEHWTNLRNCAYLEDFNKPKIIWGELSDHAKFTYDESGIFINNTMLLMTGDNLKYILSILNSKVAAWYFSQISTSSGMGTNRWLKYKIEQFPIKEISLEAQAPFITLVDKILQGKKDGIDTSAWEAEIDEMVYKLYDLTPDEIAIVEGR